MLLCQRDQPLRPDLLPEFSLSSLPKWLNVFAQNSMRTSASAADIGKRVVAQLCEHYYFTSASIAQSASAVPMATPCTDGVALAKLPPRIATHGHPRGFEAMMLGPWAAGACSWRILEERDKMFPAERCVI